jgi:hypothetical protein
MEESYFAYFLMLQTVFEHVIKEVLMLHAVFLDVKNLLKYYMS